MQSEATTYCGAEVGLGSQNATLNGTTLTDGSQYAQQLSGSDDEWYQVAIPLETFACDKGSVGNLSQVDRVDIQNINIRDADICLDNINIE
jgi:hypothetical protein